MTLGDLFIFSIPAIYIALGFLIKTVIDRRKGTINGDYTIVIKWPKTIFDLFKDKINGKGK